MSSPATTEIIPFPFSRVLILTQYYHPETGAPQIRLRAVARELVAAGVHVRVLTGMPNYPSGVILAGYRGRLTMRETIDDVPVQRVWLYAAAGRGSVKRLLNYLSFTFTATLALLFVRDVDLVFVEAQPLSLAIAARLLKQVRGIPYVYNTPDLQVEVAADARWIGLRTVIKAATWLEASLMRAALTVTSVSHAFLDHFVVHRGVARRRLSFLPNGADLAALRPLPADVAYAQVLGVNGRTTFTYAGTHAHYHGLDVIVDAAERLRHRADIVILMVGAGPVRAGLIARATRAGLRNLVFRDSPFEERARLMSITYAALVVLSDMPVARLMRAAKAIPPLACGVPIVHAGEGETASIVVHAGCGVEVAAADPQALAAAIEALADDPARRARMAIQARALAERDFSWTRLVRTWMAQVARIARDEGAGVPQGLPRIVESTAALALLVVASPLLGLAAAAVAITSPGGALFRHRRIGRGGKPFDILKLRTMTAGTGGSPLTAAGDQRVTAVGRVLRRAKLDELPSLWNVVRGDMSLVGPRPEAPEYVVLSDARWQHVLEVRPGITDPMTLQLRNEDALLAGAPDHDRFYRDYLLPYKLDGSRRHLAHRTWRGDVSVLYHTAAAVVWPPRAPAPSVSEIIARVNRLSPER